MMVKLLLLFSISSLNTDDKHFPYCLLKNTDDYDMWRGYKNDKQKNKVYIF